MKITEENLKFALEWMNQFSHMTGFPEDPDWMRLMARGVLRIVHNKSLRERCTPSQLCNEEGEIDPRIKDIVDVKDVDLLRDAILDQCDKFPMVAEMRKLYRRVTFQAPAEGSENDIIEIN